MTGDQADNMQRNETVWVRDLLEGGTTINFNSGLTDPATTPTRSLGASCPAFVAAEDGAASAAPRRAPTRASRTTTTTRSSPAEPRVLRPRRRPRRVGRAPAGPSYPGLMDRAQQLRSRRPASTSRSTSRTATTTCSCRATRTPTPPSRTSRPAASRRSARRSTPAAGPSPTRTSCSFPLAAAMLVPPDPQRQFVDKPQIKADLRRRTAATTTTASASSTPAEDDGLERRRLLLRLGPAADARLPLHLDRHQLRGRAVVEQSAPNGNIDDPQFQWLKAELDAAPAANSWSCSSATTRCAA